MFASYLSHDRLIMKLAEEIEADYGEMDQLKQSIQHAKDSMLDAEYQTKKLRNSQKEFNKKIVNEDAYYKFFAYTAVIHKNRAENPKKVLKDIEV